MPRSPELSRVPAAKTRWWLAVGLPALAAGGTSMLLAPGLLARNGHALAALVHVVAVMLAVLAAVVVVAWSRGRDRPWARMLGPAARLPALTGGAAFVGLAAASYDARQVPHLPAGGALALVSLDGLFAVVAGTMLAVALAATWGAFRAITRPGLLPGLGAAVLVTAGVLGVEFAVAKYAYIDRNPLPHGIEAFAAAASIPLGTALHRLGTRALARRRPLARAAMVAVTGLPLGLIVAVHRPLLATAWIDAELRRPAAWMFVACAAGLTGLLLRRVRWAALGWVVPAGLMFAAMPLSSRQDLPGVILRDPPIAALTFELLRRAGDFDGDGHSAWFGGRDCAPFDPDRSPFARERVGNGIDEDCSGADLRAQEFDPPPVRPSSTTRPPSSAHPDIVVVMVDTVRARELALHGGPVQTPVLDALARQSAVFDRFYALCPSTHRAMPSLLTGMLPSSLEETLAGPQAISDARTTVFEALADQGYTSNVVFGQKFMRERNLDQGVAAVHDNPHVRGHHVDPVRTRLALGLLEQWDTAPQLLWVHYYAPHAPHVAPRGHDAGDGSEQAAYAAEIQAFDTELGRLLDALRATPRGRAAWVVVTSDHGEEFYEHGYTLHARALYEESVHVPLVVHAPGFDPSRVTTPVDQLDLGTTLAAIGGARLGHGRDLRPALRGAAVPERPVLLELYPMRENTLTAVAIVDGDHKLILDLKQGLFEHFDLRNDPGEHTNRYDDAPQSAQPLRHALLRHLERAHAIR